MKPTEKNKEQFEEYYRVKNNYNNVTISEFYNLPLEMQIGVYLTYYDSKGYRVNVENFMDNPEYFRFKINASLKYDIKALATLQEAYTEAFIQANKLINKSLEE